MVPVVDEEATLQGTGPTLFGVQSKLDGLYRRHVEGQIDIFAKGAYRNAE
jgi:hypothetical protein